MNSVDKILSLAFPHGGDLGEVVWSLFIVAVRSMFLFGSKNSEKLARKTALLSQFQFFQ